MIVARRLQGAASYSKFHANCILFFFHKKV